MLSCKSILEKMRKENEKNFLSILNAILETDYDKILDVSFKIDNFSQEHFQENYKLVKRRVNELFESVEDVSYLGNISFASQDSRRKFNFDTISKLARISGYKTIKDSGTVYFEFR